MISLLTLFLHTRYVSSLRRVTAIRNRCCKLFPFFKFLPPYSDASTSASWSGLQYFLQIFMQHSNTTHIATSFSIIVHSTLILNNNVSHKAIHRVLLNHSLTFYLFDCVSVSYLLKKPKQVLSFFRNTSILIYEKFQQNSKFGTRNKHSDLERRGYFVTKHLHHHHKSVSLPF